MAKKDRRHFLGSMAAMVAAVAASKAGLANAITSFGLVFLRQKMP